MNVFLFNPLSVSFVCAVEASLKFQNQHLASRSKHGSRSKLGQPEFTPYELGRRSRWLGNINGGFSARKGSNAGLGWQTKEEISFQNLH
jgi:hypothetical protein